MHRLSISLIQIKTNFFYKWALGQRNILNLWLGWPLKLMEKGKTTLSFKVDSVKNGDLYKITGTVVVDGHRQHAPLHPVT